MHNNNGHHQNNSCHHLVSHIAMQPCTHAWDSNLKKVVVPMAKYAAQADGASLHHACMTGQNCAAKDKLPCTAFTLPNSQTE